MVLKRSNLLYFIQIMNPKFIKSKTIKRAKEYNVVVEKLGRKA